ncbi:MAG: thioredoxin fold domain-containing protein [bacterium]
MKFYVFLFLSFLNLFVIFIKIREKRNLDIPKEKIQISEKDSISFEEIPVEKPIEDKIEESVKEEEEKELPKKVSTYQEALENSKNSQSDIFIYFRSNNCHWCDKMKETLNDDKVIETLSSYTQLEVNTSVSSDMSTKFSIYGVPTYIILNSKQNIIKKDSGYKNTYDFLNWLGE